jgi:hypothetical protein
MVRLRIVEEVTYNVEADTVYDAMRDFLRDPNKYLNAVEERDIKVLTENGVEPLNDQEADEVIRAENDS